jgi:hypothetical protein
MARHDKAAAGAQARRDLRPVPEEADDDADIVAELADEMERRTVARLDPETNLLGALMHRPAPAVAEVLELLHDEDMERPLAGAVLQVIRMLVDRGRAPDPVAVVAAVRNPDRRAGVTEPGSVLDEFPGRFDTIARYVADCYTTGINADVWGTTYQVVDDAYRRSFGAAGLRLNQMAEYPADTEDIEQVAAAAVVEWRGYWYRLRAINDRSRGASVPPDPVGESEASLEQDEPAPEDDR